jgi:SSS family solute:Na+ symporter
MLHPLFLLSFCATLALIIFLAWAGKNKARNGTDFSLGGRRAGPWNVFGAITGTLVGGASTIGTAQLAFMWGVSAWWFTLGAGLACLFLGLFIAVPLRQSNCETIPQFISEYHGERARMFASLFSALGMFIQIVAQLLACGAILAVLFDMPLVWSAGVSSVLVLLFTLGGGMKSAGLTGVVKMSLIYLTMVIAGILSVFKSGGLGQLTGHFPDDPWFNLFGYGVSEGISDVLSMVVGVISTQTYLQAVFAASDGAAAKKGALLSAFFIPPLGLLGILVGLFMKKTAPGLQSALALPAFIIEHVPTPVAGIAFAALLIAAIGTASGLALGVATTLKVDVFRAVFRSGKGELALFRGLTTSIVLGAFVLLLVNLGSAIMDWSFLSMGLRGSTLFFPIIFAVFFPKYDLRIAGAISIVIAPISVIACGLLNFRLIQPLYIGMGISLVIFVVSSGLSGKKRRGSCTSD